MTEVAGDILVYDPFETGHRPTYSRLLREAALKAGLRPLDLASRRFSCNRVLGKLQLFFDVLMQSKRPNLRLLHLASADDLHVTAALLGLAFRARSAWGRWDTRVLFTYHWAREGQAFRMAFRMLGWLGFPIVTHEAFIADRIQQLGGGDLLIAPYPAVRSTARTDAPKRERKEPLLLFIGRQSSDKGISELPAIARELSALGCRARIWAVGPQGDSDIEPLRKRVRSLGLWGRVRYSERSLATEQYHRLIAGANLVLLPYRESFQGVSGCLLDGLANHRLVVSTPFAHAGQMAMETSRVIVAAGFSANDIARSIHMVLQAEPPELSNEHPFADRSGVFVERMAEIYCQAMAGERKDG